MLVVDKFSVEVHLGCQIAGVRYPLDGAYPGPYLTRGFFSILADLFNVVEGTKVFFYQRRIDEPSDARGFLGVWQATKSQNAQLVYEDTNNSIQYTNEKAILGRCPHCGGFSSEISKKLTKVICSECKKDIGGHILPLRFEIEVYQVYQRYLDDNTAYIDITDDGRLSTLIFRKIYGRGRERSVSPILPEESEKLERLLSRMESNEQNQEIPYDPKNCSSSTAPLTSPVETYLDFSKEYPLSIGNRTTQGRLYNDEGEVLWETVMEAWLMHQLACNPIQILDRFSVRDDFQVEWFGNQVLYGIGGERSDVLILLKNRDNFRCVAILIELKKGLVNRNVFGQLNRYAYWIAQLVTANVQNRIANPFFIQPVAIGRKLARSLRLHGAFNFTIPYSTPLSVQVRRPLVLTYVADPNGLTISMRS